MCPFPHRADPMLSSAEFLVVGLGNPVKEFGGTRHNVGVDTVIAIAARYAVHWKRGTKLMAQTAMVRIGGHMVVLARPTGYMNDSGKAVRRLLDSCGLTEFSRLVVVHDELDLPVGRVRVKNGGGFAGHNGLKSVRECIGRADFVRVRIGIGKPPDPRHGADYVLSKPVGEERAKLQAAAHTAAEAVEVIVSEGVERAMNKFNAVV